MHYQEWNWGEVNITFKERIAGGNQCPIEEKTQLSSMIFGETRIIPHRGSLTDGNSYFQLTVEAADGTKPNTNFSTSRDYYAEIEVLLNPQQETTTSAEYITMTYDSFYYT